MWKNLFLVLVIALMITGAGCQLTDTDTAQPQADEGGQTESVMDLDSPTGGFSYSDEQPAFGEEDEFEPLLNEVEVDDEYRNREENRERIRNLEHNERVRKYRFRALWGRLSNAYTDSAVVDCCPLDWSGTLHLEGGIILIERVIAFDINDYVTRIDRSTIEFTSHTCPHVDGIQVKLLFPPQSNTDSVSVAIEPRLVLDTPQYSHTWSIDELDSLRITEYVDRCGNGISIGSHSILPHCPRGYLVGRWKSIEQITDVEPDTIDCEKKILGVYRGMWIDENGRHSGYLKGVYGLNSEGEHVLYGKYISLSGRFRGFLIGRYGQNDEITAESVSSNGWLEGIWTDRRRVEQGLFKGRWTLNGAGVGHFHGVWEKHCDFIQ